MEPADDRLLARFLELIRIDSPSREELDVALSCAGELKELGFRVRFDDSASITRSNTGNLIAELPATSGAQTLVLCAHMDCVEPCRGVEPVVSQGVVSSAGDTILGADDKAGLAVILEACRRLVETGVPRPAIKVVFTVSEETGLTGAKALNPADVAGDACLVLDADGDPGGIIIAAPTHFTFDAQFHGVAAHAGVSPEKGVSALLMAAKALCAMELGRLDESTTANAGTIESGQATNVIPAHAHLTGECRSLDAVRVEEVRSAMDTVMHQAAHAGGGSVDVVWTREYVGFSFEPDAPIVQEAVAACADAGLVPVLKKTGGGSDGNVFSGLGVPTLVLSCGMRSVHGVEESIAVADLHSLVDLLLAYSSRLARS
ncbi:MAG: M20/M25/M40 family metallo-hydrolase [Coriobacteriia bacterium]|nr:M20/M25/M40 family metallo-hydrolase [Coriobacteriia bacterium]